MLVAVLPQSLRVRRTVTIANVRMSVRGFFALAGSMMVFLFLLAQGAGMGTAAVIGGGAALLGVTLAEARVYRRPVSAVMLMIVRYAARPRRMRVIDAR